MHKLLIGTSGFNYKDWKGIFYPEKLAQRKWLSYYAEQFNTVEINATFYGSFRQTTFKKWAAQTPAHFTFTLKGSRFITHIKRVQGVSESVERFFDAASGLGTKLSCVLWQFPENFHNTDKHQEQLRAFLETLPKQIHQVIEVRHETWFMQSFYDLLNAYHAGFVMNDSSRFPSREQITDDLVYVRFHGPGALYASSYTDDQLRQWAEKLKEYRKTRDVYCYFNNDYDARAIRNAITLRNFLE